MNFHPRLIIVNSLILFHLSCGTKLSAYTVASFHNPDSSSPFSHFALHNDKGNVYIGASDVLYQLDKDFTRKYTVSTKAECENPNWLCPNYNKILLIDYENDRLIECGSENGGVCNVRNLTNANSVIQVGTSEVTASGKFSTEAIIAPGPQNDSADALYVAKTVIDNDRSYERYLVSRRQLSGSRSLFYAEQDAYVVLLHYYDNYIHYAASFVLDNFTYFVTNQNTDSRYGYTNSFVSKLCRVCQNSDNFNSFTEVTLSCQGQNSTIYNLIQDAYLGQAGLDLATSLNISAEDKVLYGVFAKGSSAENVEPTMETAVCLFREKDIKDAFFQAAKDCFVHGSEFGIRYSYSRYDDCYGFGEGAFTTDDQLNIFISTSLCNNIYSYWGYAKSVDAITGNLVIEWTDKVPTSVATTTHSNHTVMFVGTSEGILVKVHIQNGTRGREYESLSVGSPVLGDIQVDEDQQHIILLTEQQIFRLRVESCSRHLTCDDCIGANGEQDGDPFCGWCTLERKCTLHDLCPLPDVSTRWLSYDSQCIIISEVTPRDSIPYTLTEQRITVTVEQIPDLSAGNNYRCVFDGITPVPATTVGNKLQCITPASSDLPIIPSGTDYATLQLAIYSTEIDTTFIAREFYVYDCGFHKGCVSCTNSSWACSWCIYSNKCTHDKSTCSDDDPSSTIHGINNPDVAERQGYEECPQLAAQTSETLVPVGVARSISVTGINLPQDERVNNYKCIVKIDSRELTTEAIRNGNVIICKGKMYNYIEDSQELKGSVSVVWNSNRKLGDVFGYTVTLYKCDVSRPDCSRCLSQTTARPELMCGWCKVSRLCTVSGSVACNGGWIPATSFENCPSPVLSGIWPSSGPLEGNTPIAITGSDLGQQFADIISVTVGGRDCSFDKFSQHYVTGSSVSCRTAPGTVDSEASVVVTVNGIDGIPQQSTGNVMFIYRNPSITSIDPEEGPEAGGTMVTITGQYLDACSHISATIGSAECRMNRMDDVFNETTATCRTTDAPVYTSEPLEVYFDGAMRQSADVFIYKPNPTVSRVKPLKTILSGGIGINVTGSGFDLAQAPQMIMYTKDGEFKEDCEIHNDTVLFCKTPNITSDNISRRKRDVGAIGEVNFGFIIADVVDLLEWSKNKSLSMEYFPDPEYFMFETDPQAKEYDLYLIKGRNLDTTSSKDVAVYVGREEAEIESLSDEILTVTFPETNPGRECINGNQTRYPCVLVYHGNLEFYIGSLQYPGQGFTLSWFIYGGICALVIIVIISAVICRYMVQHRQYKKQKDALILKKLIMLQKIVEEEVQNIKRAGNKTSQPSIVLPNNIHVNPEDVKIRYNELTMGRSLGHGAFGEVFQAELRTTRGGTKTVAVKSIQGEKDPSTIIKFLEEGLIMKDFDHPNVLGLIGLTFDPEGNPLVVLPLMKNGDLKHLLKKTTMTITIAQRLQFAIDAAKGMAYLAGKKFVHRDLAARNCMVDEELMVKIGDFGRSRDLEEDYDYISEDKKAKIPVKWMAPESLDRRLYNEKTDVWSFGVLIWEIFTDGAKPYKGITNKDVYYHITGGNRLPCPDNCREDVYDVMMQCWNINPKDRCKFQELSSMLLTIRSLVMQTREVEFDDKADTGGAEAINRDSYLHPMEGPATQNGGIQNGESLENERYTSSSDLLAPNRDSYLHPMGENNGAVVMEMKDMDMS